jgi:hypothetical protein
MRAWSYSLLRDFEQCPRQCYEVKIAKKVREEPGEALLWGSQVHEAMQFRLVLGKKLPERMDYLERWAKLITELPGDLKVEQELALDVHYQSCDWFSKETWVRAKVDAIKLHNGSALILDWKTGRMRGEDKTQLGLSAAVTAACFPGLHQYCATYVWLEDKATTSLKLNLEQVEAVWDQLTPRVQALQEADRDQDWPERPGRHCRWCPVRACPFNQRGGK